MKSLCVLFGMLVVAACVAVGQTSPSDQTGGSKASAAAPKSNDNASAGPSVAATAAANESTGTIVEFVSGQSLVLNTGGTEPSHFKVAKTVAISNPRGKSVATGKLKKDRRVQVHYNRHGDDFVVDRIMLVREKKR